MLGRIMTVHAVSLVFLAIILAPLSTSTRGLVTATSPACNLRVSSAVSSVSVPVRVETTVADVTVRRAGVTVRGHAVISSVTASLSTSALPA